MPSGRTRGNRHKLKHREFNLSTRKYFLSLFFILKVLKLVDRLPGEALEASSVGTHKTQVGTVLDNTCST